MDLESNRQRIKSKIDELLVKLPEPVGSKLLELEKTTGQPKSLLAGAIGIFGLLIFLFLCPPPLVFSFVGVAFVAASWCDGVIPRAALRYPMYASMKMLAEEDTADCAMWITYWCLFTSFKLVMAPLDFILSFLPFYFYLKLALLVWLFSPTTKGAAVVFEKAIKPFVLPVLLAPKSD